MLAFGLGFYSPNAGTPQWVRLNAGLGVARAEVGNRGTENIAEREPACEQRRRRLVGTRTVSFDGVQRLTRKTVKSKEIMVERLVA